LSPSQHGGKPLQYDLPMRRLALLALAVTLTAQDPRGFINGTVTDSSGATIPNTPITLNQIRTGVVFRAASNDQGIYEANYLPAGEYTITAALTGFKSFTRANIELRIGDRLRVDIALEPGASSEKIEVSAELPILRNR